MCGPDLSSLWFYDAVDSRYNVTSHRQYIKLKKVVKTSVHHSLMNTCPTVEKIYWAGGESVNNGRALVCYEQTCRTRTYRCASALQHKS